MNIVWDSEGNVRCTDPIIRWEQGERYRLQTEEEVEQDEANEKKMDALFDDEEIEAQIESVYQNHFLALYWKLANTFVLLNYTTIYRKFYF